ncbi:MAG: hypothetical protein AABW83_03405 [Nanoarchaeota archaeon]
MANMVSFNPDILQILPPETSTGIITLMSILKTVGIIFIIYFALQIINLIMNIKRNKRIKIIEEKTISIENKINKLLNKNNKTSNK